ncbi:MAG: hypothetical protein U0T73_05105 [Chitinophagales bacterium]
MRKTGLFLFCVVLSLTAVSQAASPFSRYGLGFVRPVAFSSNRAMAELGAGYSSNMYINPVNPASNSEFTLTNFEVGANLDAVNIRTKDSTYSGFNGSLSHLALGVPLIRGKWGLSFGLLPFSSLNYNFTQRNIDSFKVFRGSGSLAQVFVGTGFKVKGFSFGVNFGYVFGKLEYYRGFAFTDSLLALNVRNNSQMRVGGFNYNIGVQYKIRLKKKTSENSLHTDVNFTAGAYGSGGVKFNTTVSTNWERYYYSSSLGNDVVVDTPLSYSNQKGKIVMPYNFGVGFTAGNEAWWFAGVDFRYAGWSQFNSPIQTEALANSWRLSVGAGITPNLESKNFLGRVQYKGGAYYGKSEVIYAGKQLSEYGGTLGLSLPIRLGAIFREAARIHLMADIGSRGTGDKTLLSENYYRVYFGFTLSNLWFQKRKFD